MRKKENAKLKKSKRKRSLLPLAVISAAVRGEEPAIGQVLTYYERYITRLASKELYDRYGNLYICVDYELKTELQNKLIAGILKFRAV
ncbi:helix-turn-helix domain-containing protein [Sporomusa acidovorans]|uniref:helix-turn-helix domain-containing protein n=1 Tax=Sporomusa acidovorans TaxID=112900 RepID=UPI000880A637|nr:helix-turn-helix domain-containing protein [Sporomusa acidovorans]OZC19145.1 helix-turn-helix domain protein [Sporomusa acidovorans DSM 3132]SDD68853.1 Helix-turn-helix domain-containing protein [Sporomusa acidovorans]